jgi:hypothetical protein
MPAVLARLPRASVADASVDTRTTIARARVIGSLQKEHAGGAIVAPPAEHRGRRWTDGPRSAYQLNLSINCPMRPPGS